MRPEEGNPLDLNNLPGEDYSGGGYRKKKNRGVKDESGKVYECRFCSLKFGKSQALGGHMNRHRQERETETLNRARQLVFTNDNLIPPTPPPHHLLGGQVPMSLSHGGYHHQTSDAFRSAAARYYCASSSSPNIPPPPPPPQSYMYPSPPRLIPSHYINNPQPINDYFVGHAVHTQFPTYTAAPPPENNYTCIGAPVVGHGFGRVQNKNDNIYSIHKNNDEGEEGGMYHNSSVINRYQDGIN